MEILQSYNVYARRRFHVIISLFYSPSTNQYYSNTCFEPVVTGATDFIGGFPNQWIKVEVPSDIVHSQVHPYIEKYELINVCICHLLANLNLSLPRPLIKIVQDYLEIIPVLDQSRGGTIHFQLEKL